MNFQISLIRILRTFLLLFILQSCSSAPSGRYVRIGHPYSLSQIEKMYQVNKNEIELYNRGKSLENGTWVFVPRPIGVLVSSRHPSFYNSSNGSAFSWPLDFSQIEISSDYGYRGFSHHDGIDLPAPRKTPILAVSDGVVTVASRVKGYGKTVIIDHGAGIETLYAHSSSLVVSVGQKVQKGQIVALVGATGRATGNHLHFEVRIRGESKDPLKYLPQDRAIAFK